MRKIATILTIICLIVVGIFLVSNWKVLTYEPIVKLYAEQNNVSPSLILAMIKAESNFNSGAVSSAGAVGLMQIMPDTATWISSKTGIDNAPQDALTNIAMGTWYMGSFLLPKYNGDEDKALMAYNAGHGNVDSWDDGTIPFPETDAYVKKVKWWEGIFGIYEKLVQ